MPSSGNPPLQRHPIDYHPMPIPGNRAARRARHAPRTSRTARVTLSAVVPVAMLIATAGIVQAAEPLTAIADQPGVTGPIPENQGQTPGESTTNQPGVVPQPGG